MAIRAKLVIIFFLIIIAPMFLLWARWQGTALGGIKSVMRQGLADRAREISDQVTRSLQEHRVRITSLTKQPGLATYARAAAARSGQVPLDYGLQIDLSAFLTSHYKEYSALIIINRRGAPLYKLEPGELYGVTRAFYTDADFTSEDVVSAPEAFAPATDQIFVSEVQQDTSGPHVKLISPLRDAANNVTSALVVKLRAEELLTAAAGPRIPETSDRYSPAAVILSPAGVVLYAADPAKQGRMYDESFPDLSDVFASLREGQGKNFDRDQWVFSSHLRENATKLSILMIGDYSKGAKQLDFDSYVLLLLTMLLVIVAMLALYYLISEITDSIRRVTKGAKSIAMGNLTYQIKIKAKDETRVLAEAFNRMGDRLREMIRKEGEQRQFESFARLSSVLTHDLKNQILSLSLLVNNMERKFDREGF